ncbi:MAG: 2-oxoacid:ferredoxin oxidoreductase subunit beta [Bacteroidetes bacterium]|nr:MAG: 2-oxoacid:ferredoxin oxidoreductase subunit beta [Bacteroidota bacterium]PIE88586.1 MAG: 2-oxoacid:ferredoxin oxidoreductase subunit beta [Bacteroidota bacterium]
MSKDAVITQELTAKDFVSDQMVKWCPGCGDHAILASLEKVLPKLGKRKEDILVISGIGCSSRFPYYVNTYGFHGIHGRALAIASGARVANPELSIWVASGDGDSMAIGGNHFIHAIRRNLDLNMILFNNEIYGLTKGQYSPTTPFGKKTKTSPYGTIEDPFVPGELCIGAQGTFFARTLDANPRAMTETFLASAAHKGMSVVEVLQNCVIFNNGAHNYLKERGFKEDRQLWLKDGERMIFGKAKNKGLVFNGSELQVVTIGENGVTEEDILVHDASTPNPLIHLQLVRMKAPDFPVAFGVIRNVKKPSYERLMEEQIAAARAESPIKTADDLFNRGITWEVE